MKRASCVVFVSLALGISPLCAADMPPLVAKAPPAPAGGNFWIGVDYLLWSMKGDKLPPLVTAGGTGVLGAPGTSVLFGDSRVNEDWRSGGRIRAGYWFDPGRKAGIEAQFFGLENASTKFAASSNGATLLARPFLNVLTGAQDVLILASPATGSGQIGIEDTSRLLGAGIVYRKELCGNCAAGSVSGLIGYRYLRLRDDLRISTSQLLTNILFLGTTTTSTDQFSTKNQFHGLDLGLTGEIVRDRWTFEWLAKIALGETFSDLGISGSTTIMPPGGPSQTLAGGFLALPSNIGKFSDSRFAVVPEVGMKVGYQITPQWRASVGYDLIYWSRVTRVGGAIDTAIDPNQIPPPLASSTRPQPQFGTTDFWAHGVNFGLAYRY